MNTASLWLVRPAALARVLLTLVGVLLTLSLLGQYSKYALGHDTLKGFVPLFYVDLESNVPTWYSSVLLLLAAGLCALLARHHIAARLPYRRHWLVLAALFLLLSLDEIAMLHEYPIDPLREALGTTGPLYYAWVIPGLAAVVVCGLAYVRCWWHLPARTRGLCLLAAAAFVGGAVGVEMLSGMQASRYGEQNLTYALIVHLEEALEMLGVVIFIYALADYVARYVEPLSIGFVLQPPECELAAMARSAGAEAKAGH
jgi:hypothetical protein